MTTNEKKESSFFRIQWFKNGDHPLDDCHMVTPDPNSTTQFEPFLSEGKIVRYFRNPEIGCDSICLICGKNMGIHGWIDPRINNGIQYIVCPGDYIDTIKDHRGYTSYVYNSLVCYKTISNSPILA